MSLSVKIEGLSAVNKRLAKFSSGSKSNLAAAINKATAVVEGGAKRNCPVDTGNLRGSIHISPAKEEGNQISGEVYTNTEYAPYVEFGTGRRGGYPYKTKLPLSYRGDWPGQAAQPFLGKSLHENEKIVRTIIKSALGKAVKNA